MELLPAYGTPATTVTSTTGSSTSTEAVAQAPSDMFHYSRTYHYPGFDRYFNYWLQYEHGGGHEHHKPDKFHYSLGLTTTPGSTVTSTTDSSTSTETGTSTVSQTSSTTPGLTTARATIVLQLQAPVRARMRARVP